MFQDAISARGYKCPNCGDELVSVCDILRCEKHGEFFIYGPQLLVHVPSQSIKLPNSELPWEHRSVYHPQ